MALPGRKGWAYELHVHLKTFFVVFLRVGRLDLIQDLCIEEDASFSDEELE